MAKPEEYGISVRLVQEDGTNMYEARVVELPDVRVFGESVGDAYAGALDVIKTSQEIFSKKGKPFPSVEVPEDEFSGRVTLRMSKSLHRAINGKAYADGVSLNQWIIESVASRVRGDLVAANSVLIGSPVKVRPDQYTLGLHKAFFLGTDGNFSVFSAPQLFEHVTSTSTNPIRPYSSSGELVVLEGGSHGS